MTSQDSYTIIGSSVGSIFLVGLTLAVLIMRTTSRLDRRIDQVATETAADRRQFQTAMDDFRKEMQRLAERQSRLEGVRGA